MLFLPFVPNQLIIKILLLSFRTLFTLQHSNFFKETAKKRVILVVEWLKRMPQDP